MKMLMDNMENFDNNIGKSQGWIEISSSEFNNLSNFVYKNIGINLTDQKMTLLMGRLQKILKKYQLKSFSEYYNFLLNDHDGSFLSEFANIISTNHTFFFRESDHFDYFSKYVLPEIDERLKTNKSTDIRIWSAGCSSGEEPYFLTILMKEYFGNRYNTLSAGVLATDISTKVLQQAQDGIFSDERIHNLPDYYKKKYFHHLPDGRWQISSEIIKEVTFRRFNLMNEIFPFKKSFDVIFCRNVMIYFDTPTRDTLINKFYNGLIQDGYLFIGHSETLNKKDSGFKFLAPAIYKK